MSACRIPRSHLSRQLRFHASVLHLRGDSIAKQPFEANGDVLIYVRPITRFISTLADPVRPQNGEIFDGLDVDAHENDGQVLFAALQAGPSVLYTLRKIEGPYAFVYYEHANRSLYWARDPLGRRSLMQSRPNVQSRPNGSTRNISLTSVAPPGQDCWSEVETSCVFSLALDSWQETQHPRLHLMQAAGQPEAQVGSLYRGYREVGLIKSIHRYTPSTCSIQQFRKRKT